jgi:hypothetical protein
MDIDIIHRQVTRFKKFEPMLEEVYANWQKRGAEAEGRALAEKDHPSDPRQVAEMRRVEDEVAAKVLAHARKIQALAPAIARK